MRTNPTSIEVLQLLPVVVVALPIVLSGEVDLAALGGSFSAASSLSLLVMGFVAFRQALYNPILLGAYVWLGLGGFGFAVGVRPLAAWLADVQGFGLVACILLMLGLSTLQSPYGAIGADAEPAWVRRSSLALLALALACAAWSWAFRDDVRLGGGLPFIVLNVARRAAIAHRARQEA